MLTELRLRKIFICAVAIALLAVCFVTAAAQADDPANGETDPVKVFERGQDAHAKGDYKLAIQLYDAAIKLKPEFPEAEFQRAMALIATNRKPEALEGFNRAAALRPDWAMAYSKFGSELAFTGASDREAEPILRRAIELNDKDLLALTNLAVLRSRAGDSNEAVKLIRTATSLKDATHETWRRRAYLERSAGDLKAAVASITRAMDLDPRLSSDHYDRARFLLEMNDRAGALADLDAAKLDSTAHMTVVIDVAQLYARAGRSDESLRLLDALS